MQRKEQAFTLIEISIAVVILLLLLALAVPSLTGVLADRRLRRSYDDLNNFVASAQERSLTERRAYLIAWQENQIILRPEALEKNEEKQTFPALRWRKGEAFALKLPAALIEDPPREWVFWPSGACEPAIVTFKGADGTWTARYSSLTARAELSNYVAK